MLFPISNFNFVVVTSISSEWKTRAFLIFGLIKMGGWSEGGGGKDDILRKWHCIASWTPPSMCVWKPYFDNLSIQVLEDVVMTLCFACCRYQVLDCTNHWFPDVCTQNITNTSSRKTFPFSCCPQKLIWSYTVCISFHKGNVYRKKTCNQFGLSWMCWGDLFLSPLQLLARPNPIEHVIEEQQPNANRIFIYGWHVWSIEDKF
jgi:hypothetical protein